MTACVMIVVLALFSYILGHRISAKYQVIQNWKTTKKKRLALAWAILLGCILLCIKSCQYQLLPIDAQSSGMTLQMLEALWFKKSLNGCFVLSVMMGVCFYLGMQRDLQLYIQQQAESHKLRQRLLSSI